MAFSRFFASGSRRAGPRPWLFAAFLIAQSVACGKESPAGPDDGSGDLGISATRLAFESDESEETVELENRGATEVPWKVETSVEWLVVSPSSGTLAPGTVPVSVRLLRQLLELGTQAGEIRFTLGQATFVVTITAVNPGVALAKVEPESLHLGPDDSQAAITLSNPGEGPLSWTLAGPSWVTIDPSGGSLSPEGSIDVELAVDRTGLQDGLATATLSMSSNGGEPTVELVVEVASPAKLALSFVRTDFGTSLEGLVQGVSNVGGRPLTWSSTGGSSWVTLSPASGTVDPHKLQPVVIDVSREGLTAGSYETRFTFSSNGGAQDLVVQMQVESSSPPPPPPPPPAPPPEGSTALEGRVVDQFNGAGVAGLTVSFAGATATTDGSGNFSIPGQPSSSLRDLELEGSSIHTRRTFARGDDDRWEVIPSSFAISPFNDVAREYEPRTIRWTQNPKVYIDTRAHPGGGSAPPEWIDEAEDTARDVIGDWSGGVLQASSVTTTSSPPAEGTPGAIVIEFNEDPTIYSSPSAVGLTRTFWTSQRAITSAHIWLRFNGIGDSSVRVAVLAHELGHGMGMGHMNGSTSSIMKPTIATSSLTTFDRRTGDIVYSRSPGNTSPDTDSQSTFLSGLAPAGLPAGSYEWVCGVE
ncbi:MAG: BACON domain-containing protein [Gemmatimonadota bacterium]